MALDPSFAMRLVAAAAKANPAGVALAVGVSAAAVIGDCFQDNREEQEEKEE